MTQQLRLAVVTAGLSEDASTTKLARALATAVSAVAVGPVRVDVVDLREHAHRITDAMLTGIVTGPLREAVDTVLDADGLIAASPTYKASYSGLFKSFFDLFDESSLHNLPTVVAATGGTPRHSLVLDAALRPLFSYLKALVLPMGVYAAAEDWGHPSLQRRIDAAGRELALVMGARTGDDAAQPAVGADPHPGAGHEPAGEPDHLATRVLPGEPAVRRRRHDEFANAPRFEDLLAAVGR